MIEQLKQLINRKQLLQYLVGSELSVQYKNKLLGPLWAVLDPLFLMLVYVLLVKVIFQKGGPQFPVLLFSALLAWRWFTQSIITSVKCLTSNAKLVQTVKFPLPVLPLSKVLFSFSNYLMGSLVLVPLLFLFDATFSWHLLWLPVLILIQFFFNTGAAMIAAVIGVYLRDLHNILLFVVRLGFYLSPALYSVADLPVYLQQAYVLINPFASLFESLKNILVLGEPIHSFIWLYALCSFLLFILGLHLFNRNKNLAKDL